MDDRGTREKDITEHAPDKAKTIEKQRRNRERHRVRHRERNKERNRERKKREKRKGGERADIFCLLIGILSREESASSARHEITRARIS